MPQPTQRVKIVIDDKYHRMSDNHNLLSVLLVYIDAFYHSILYKTVLYARKFIWRWLIPIPLTEKKSIYIQIKKF